MRRGRSATPQVLVLVVMLLLVLFARYEAGKPENWEWMGFEEQGTATVNESSSDQGSALVADGTASSVARLTEEQRSVEVPRFKSAPTGSTVSKLAQLSEVDPPNDSIDVVPDLDSIKASIETGGNVEQGQAGSGSASASEFWRSILGKMKPEQQSNFLKMLRSIRHSEPLDPEIRQSCASLVRVIGKNRDKYHQALFDRLTLATDGSEEKRKISSDLFESQSVWDKKIFPAFNATVKGEDFTLAQLQAVSRLQTTLDPILFDQVLDKTAIGWAGDSEAWKRTWEIVLGGPEGALTAEEAPPSFEPVTRIELMSQPKYYRGKPIKVKGWVRSARFDKIGENSKLGIPHQYILWVRPKETKQGPYCVYAHELPAGFPELKGDEFQDLNEHVEIEGYFFKIRTYVATDNTALNSPLIVASKLNRIAPVEHIVVNNWQPSRTFLIGALLLMPVLATAIAWWAFRSTKTKPYQPGAKTAGKIDKTLGALATDSSVQTDREKIQALYDSEYDSELHDQQSEENN